MVVIYETLPEPAGVMHYTPGRLPHQESINFALDHLKSIGRNVDSYHADIVIDWFFPTTSGTSWVSLMQSADTIFLFRQDVEKFVGGTKRKFGTPLVRVVEGEEWLALAAWPRVTPNVDGSALEKVREWLADPDEWVDLVAWYQWYREEANV